MCVWFACVLYSKCVHLSIYPQIPASSTIALSTLFLGPEPPHEPVVHWLVDYLFNKSSCCCPPLLSSAGITGVHTATPSFLHDCWWSELMFSCWHGKIFIFWIISSLFSADSLCTQFSLTKIESFLSYSWQLSCPSLKATPGIALEIPCFIFIYTCVFYPVICFLLNKGILRSV